MKVSLIIERFDIALGGAERSVCELSAELESMGLNVTLLTATGQSSLPTVKVLSPESSNKRISFAQFGSLLNEHLSKNSYDIVHSTLPYDFAHVYQPRGGSYLETMIRNAASFQNPFKVFMKLKTHRLNWKRNDLIIAERLY